MNKSNLTESTGTAKLVHDVQHREGYSIVQFERKGRDLVFDRVVSSGQSEKRRQWLERLGRDYVAYAVTEESEKVYRVNVQVTKDHTRDLTVHCDIYFKVINPKTIATYYSQDPLGIVIDETRRAVAKATVDIPWKDLVDGSVRLDEFVAAERILDRINSFGSKYGIAVTRIESSYSVPELYTEPTAIKDRVDVIQQTASFRKIEADIEHEQKMQRMIHGYAQEEIQRANMLAEAGVEIFIDAFKQKIIDARTEREKMEWLGRLKQLVNDTNPAKSTTEIAGGAEGSLRIPEIESLASSSMSSAGPFGEVLAAIEKDVTDRTLRNQFMGDIRHLQTELEIGDHVDWERVKKYITPLDDYIRDSKHDHSAALVDSVRDLKLHVSRHNQEDGE